jgi:hypothetical protein
MIQRIQTVYLLMSAIAFGLLFVVPVAHVATADDPALRGDFLAQRDLVLMALAIAGIAGSLGNIFLYTRRPLQITICWVIVFVALAFGGYAAWRILATNIGGNIWIGMILPLISANMCMMAARGIRRDEELVRSSDRIR